MERNDRSESDHAPGERRREPSPTYGRCGMGAPLIGDIEYAASLQSRYKPPSKQIADQGCDQPCGDQCNQHSGVQPRCWPGSAPSWPRATVGVVNPKRAASSFTP